MTISLNDHKIYMFIICIFKVHQIKVRNVVKIFNPFWGRLAFVGGGDKCC